MGRGGRSKTLLPLADANTYARVPFHPFEVEDLLLIHPTRLLDLIYTAGVSTRRYTRLAAVLWYLLHAEGGVLDAYVRAALKTPTHTTLANVFNNLRVSPDLARLDGARLAIADSVALLSESS